MQKKRRNNAPGGMYPIEPTNMFEAEFSWFSTASFGVDNVEIPKSETKAVMSLLRSTLLGFRSQCITTIGDWWCR